MFCLFLLMSLSISVSTRQDLQPRCQCAIVVGGATQALVSESERVTPHLSWPTGHWLFRDRHRRTSPSPYGIAPSERSRASPSKRGSSLRVKQPMLEECTLLIIVSSPILLLRDEQPVRSGPCLISQVSLNPAKSHCHTVILHIFPTLPKVLVHTM